ncbi:MAG: hypothetical protein Q7R79_02775 [bacterium]|nr:hypothetical protein [bacterium]
MEAPHKTERIPQQDFEKKAHEKKRGMLDSFLEKHPNLGRRATTLALAMMGTVGVFSKMEHAQATMLEKPEDVMELVQDPKAFETLKAVAVSSSKLEAPSHVKVSYTEHKTYEATNDRYTPESKADLNGTLQMSGKNVFVASAFSDAQVSAEKNGKKLDQSFVHSKLLFGETSGTVVPTGEAYTVTGYSDSGETEALSSVLQNAAREGGQEITSASGMKNMESTLGGKQLSEGKYLQYVSTNAQGSYLASYEVVNVKKSPSGVIEVSVRIQPGILQQ